MEKELLENESRDPIPGEYGHPLPRELMLRELGFNGPFSRHSIGKKFVSHTLATKAVHTLCTKESITKRKFKLPTGARTTFHMAFSPNGTKVASCHGDHNVYVCDVASGEVIQTLTGHPRTPWCVVFHPTQNDILASGCLAGQVRVWDLKGGSEMLITDSGTVIASLAFHPTVRLLAIATFNEIIFWDWGLPYPLARCSTESTKEKVRLVRFDRLGRSLITGITNFPNPPFREGFTRSSNSNPFFRPNILSRASSTRGSYFRSGVESRYARVDNDEPEVDGNRDEDGTINDLEVRVNPADPEISLEVAIDPPEDNVEEELNDRQDRFQESYRQLVNHYQDLVTHYQQFLRSRIPRLLETSRVMRELPSNRPAHSLPLASSLCEQTNVHVVGSPEPNTQMTNPPVIQPVEPVVMPVAGPSRLMQLEARLLAQLNEPSRSGSRNSLRAQEGDGDNSSSSSGSTSGAEPNRRDNNDLRSIEALAQNILEMQNLCSQARRDAPITIETQHIIELQNIRQHLEILQEQTRELQSSIRATLTSLARGSLDALRSHVSSSTQVTPPLDTIDSSPVQPSEEPNSSAQFGSSNSPFLRITFGSRPSYSEAESVSSGEQPIAASRSRVPPIVTMQYDVNTEGLYRARYVPPSSSSSPTVPEGRNRLNEPVAGPSRESRSAATSEYNSSNNGGNNGNANNPTRRFVREFHLYGSRGQEHEHARNCPLRDLFPVRPPPRMRCLVELGEIPTLTVWPTNETGMENATRNFRHLESRDLSPSASENSGGAPQQSIYDLPPLANNNGQNERNLNQSQQNLASFAHWMNNGPTWVSNDMGVSTFLTVRQFGESNPLNQIRSGEESNEIAQRANGNLHNQNSGEHWQNLFSSGLALVPPSVRQGQKLSTSRRRRTGSVMYHPGSSSTRPFPFRQSPWDEFRASPPTSLSSASLKKFPPRLNGNFSLSFYMRMGDENIPVYSHLEGTRDEVRDGHQPNIFHFPIGLFLEGTHWEGGTQTIGIHWQPSSREEEESLAEYRRTEALIPIYDNDSELNTRRINPRHRIVFDSSTLEIFLLNNFSLVLVQPGLQILDAVTTAANLPRPRPTQGVVYIDHVSPFLDSLERLFGHRLRRAISFIAGSHFGNMPNPSVIIRNSNSIPGPSRIPLLSLARSRNNNGSGNQQQEGNLEGMNQVHIETVQADSFSRRYIQRVEAERARRLDSSSSSSSRRFFAVSTRNQPGTSGSSNGTGTGEERPERTFSNLQANNAGNQLQFRRRVLAPSNSMELPEHDHSLGEDELLFSPASHPRYSITGARIRQYFDPEGSMDIPDNHPSARRIIRLAVDTATAEVLRRQNNGAGPGSISRAIESRIERVLNERGNRGVSNSDPPAPDYTRHDSTTFGEATRSRLEEIQMRISMFSRGLHGQRSTEESNGGPSTSRGHSRRRPYPRSNSTSSSNGDQWEDESAPPLPPRIARMSTGGVSHSSQYEQQWIGRLPPGNRQRHDSAFQIGGYDTVEFGRPHGEHWLIRRESAMPPGLRNRPPSATTTSGALGHELGGSARTRATNTGAAAFESPEPRAGPAGREDAQNNNNGQNPFPPFHRLYQVSNDEQMNESGARFYPGYIPEILITPRARPPTYYTMDAATTAFLSSRIQKWDFSQFTIPDITKREDYVVVRECSLHSDACLDVSSDSDFLAVLQPSDNGSYSAVGIYSLRDETLGDILHIYHFDQNTVSVSVSPSCDYIVVGYAGRGPFYRFVHPSRNIGQILSLTRDGERVKLVPVKELFADSQSSLMSINCMHWVPVPGYGIIYGTNTGELVLLS